MKIQKLRKGDEVRVVTGKDKGKSGKIDKVFPKIGKVLLPGINEFKRHVKGRAQGKKSEIITIVKPLPMANVQLICPKCHVVTRIGFTIEDGKKSRICKKCEQTL